MVWRMAKRTKPAKSAPAPSTRGVRREAQRGREGKVLARLHPVNEAPVRYGKHKSRPLADQSGAVVIGRNGQPYSAKRMAALQRGRETPRYAATVPTLTDQWAIEFVKLLMAGFPPTSALAYFSPRDFKAASKAMKQQWLDEWTDDDRVTTELEKVNGGKWQELDKGDRIRIAMEKHQAEMAYFLYTHNFNTMEGVDQRRAEMARETLGAILAGGDGTDPLSPYAKALKDIVEGKASAPPQLAQISEGMAGAIPLLLDRSDQTKH